MKSAIHMPSQTESSRIRRDAGLCALCVDFAQLHDGKHDAGTTTSTDD